MTTRTKASKECREAGFGQNALKRAVIPGRTGTPAGAGASESEVAAQAIVSCCGRLAERLDWQFSVSANPEERVPVQMTVGENDYALRSGRYIKVNLLPGMDTIWFTGGYYDIYFCPITVFDRSIHFNELSGDCLDEVLADVYERLEGLSISYAQRSLM